VIVGAGPGGYVAALKAGQLGASVAVVENGPLGGACLNVGCIPSKALLASAELLHKIHGAAAMGVEVAGPVTFNWPKIQTRKDKVIATLRGGIKSLFAGRKVTLFQGRAVLAGPGKVAVTGKDGTVQELLARSTILAVGSTPARIPGWPTDPAVVCTSDEALHWPALPRKLLIVGGGIIGCEFACMMQAFGVEVTIVEMMPRILPELDGSLAEAMLKVLTRRKIKCLTGTKVQALAVAGAIAKATLTDGQTIEADKVLVAVGRRPATANLGLETMGLATDRGFVRVDDYMETPVKGVYCIGDANGRCLLAHAASAHGVSAVENILRPDHRKPFTAPIPSCVYTFPEIGVVGISQEQARAKGIPVAIGSFPVGYLGKAMAVGDAEGFVKVIRHRETGELLGVHMMGHNVTECIAAAGAMMHEKVTVRELAEVVFSHPTISESLKEAAEDALGMALHLPPRKVLRVAANT
jgi:dihydrolipoamide dehydrogenase